MPTAFSRPAVPTSACLREGIYTTRTLRSTRPPSKAGGFRGPSSTRRCSGLRAGGRVGRDKNRFAHWLTRQVGYEAMLVQTRRTIHGVAGECIDGTCRQGGWVSGASPGAVHLLEEVVRSGSTASTYGPASAELAHHSFASGDETRGAAWALLSAARLEGRCRFDEASAACDTAARVLQDPGGALGRGVLEYLRGRIADRPATIENSL